MITILLCVVCLGIGYWVGGSNPARVVALVDWIKTKPWKSKPKGP